MGRYFIEVAYKGTAYSGFQIQQNAATIQSEVEKAFCIVQGLPNREGRPLFTGSSRTDAGVHALQNFFHFDFDQALHPNLVYKMNAVLPPDVAVSHIWPMPPAAHCRFDATAREYLYHVHTFKNPFVQQTSCFYPYPLNWELMHQAAAFVKEQTNFFAFAKTNSQVSNYFCKIYISRWQQSQQGLTYNIKGNRFLRGMVRLLTASMLRVGRGQLSLKAFEQLFINPQKSGYAVPAHGLFLKEVQFPENYFAACSAGYSQKQQ